MNTFVGIAKKTVVILSYNNDIFTDFTDAKKTPNQNWSLNLYECE